VEPHPPHPAASRRTPQSGELFQLLALDRGAIHDYGVSHPAITPQSGELFQLLALDRGAIHD
jgi:hypothetical protein